MKPPDVRLVAAAVFGLVLSSALDTRAQTPADEPPPASASEDDAKQRAKEHFQRGLEFLSQSEWAPALAEFLKSRELYPNRSNTQDAAVALSKLGRYDEALDMFDKLLHDFKNIPDKDLSDVEREIKRLQGFVGSVEIRSSVRGATVVIDGRMRGTTPLSGRLRVNAGSHAVRVFKQGSAPFETHVDVAAGETETVSVTLTTLESSGRLKVNESRGRSAEVAIDGIVVGNTPWEGSLVPGKHSIALRGSGNLGTPPANTLVRANDVTVFTLALEPLECSLRVDPQPVNATVAIDSVEVGQGTWDGRLRCGSHRIEVGAEGFLPASRTIAFGAGKTETVALELDRDPDSPLWRAANPPRVFVEAEADGVVSNSFGGAEASSCSGDCTKTLPLGFFAGAHGGYQLGSGVGLGVAVGYLWIQTKLTNRRMTTYDVPSHDPQFGVGDDRLTLHGLTLGVDAHLQRGSAWPWMVRFGAGVLLGSLEDRRFANVRFTQASGSVQAGTYGPRSSLLTARYAYIAPEFRLARRFGTVEVSFGVRPMLLIAITQPTFQTNGAGVLDPPTLGFVDFDETATGRTVYLIMAGIGARYSFM